jgi:hypothetical protein
MARCIRLQIFFRKLSWDTQAVKGERLKIFCEELRRFKSCSQHLIQGDTMNEQEYEIYEMMQRKKDMRAKYARNDK